MNREELIDYLLNTEEFSKGELESMSNYELFNAYCNWEGLLCWSHKLWNTCKKLQKDE